MLGLVGVGIDATLDGSVLLLATSACSITLALASSSLLCVSALIFTPLPLGTTDVVGIGIGATPTVPTAAAAAFACAAALLGLSLAALSISIGLEGGAGYTGAVATGGFGATGGAGGNWCWCNWSRTSCLFINLTCLY